MSMLPLRVNCKSSRENPDVWGLDNKELDNLNSNLTDRKKCGAGSKFKFLLINQFGENRCYEVELDNSGKQIEAERIDGMRPFLKRFFNGLAGLKFIGRIFVGLKDYRFGAESSRKLEKQFRDFHQIPQANTQVGVKETPEAENVQVEAVPSYCNRITGKVSPETSEKKVSRNSRIVQDELNRPRPQYESKEEFGRPVRITSTRKRHDSGDSGLGASDYEDNGMHSDDDSKEPMHASEASKEPKKERVQTLVAGRLTEKGRTSLRRQYEGVNKVTDPLTQARKRQGLRLTEKFLIARAQTGTKIPGLVSGGSAAVGTEKSHQREEAVGKSIAVFYSQLRAKYSIKEAVQQIICQKGVDGTVLADQLIPPEELRFQTYREMLDKLKSFKYQVVVLDGRGEYAVSEEKDENGKYKFVYADETAQVREALESYRTLVQELDEKSAAELEELKAEAQKRKQDSLASRPRRLRHTYGEVKEMMEVEDKAAALAAAPIQLIEVNG